MFNHNLFKDSREADFDHFSQSSSSSSSSVSNDHVKPSLVPTASMSHLAAITVTIFLVLLFLFLINLRRINKSKLTLLAKALLSLNTSILF